MIVPLGTYAYARERGRIPAVETRNVYFEEDPTNLKTGSAMLTRPALQPFANVGVGPIRHIFWKQGVLNSKALVVSAGDVFTLDETSFFASLGALPGAGAVQMAASATEVLMTAGQGMRITNGVAFAAKTLPGYANVVSVAQLNGYFLAVPAGTSRIYYTDPLTGEFSALRFISAERYADNLAKIEIIGDEIWAFGEGSGSLEILVPTGRDTSDDPPFQRIEGRAFEIGAMNARAIVKAGEIPYWIGNSPDAGVTIYRGNGVPQPISTPSEAELLRQADADDMTAWAFGQNGHTFISFGYGAGTRVFDITSNRFCDWQSYGLDFWRVTAGLNVWNGAVLAGDYKTGQVWTVDPQATDDDGEEITQVLTAGLPVSDRASITSIALDCAVGQAEAGEEPTISLEHSDDQGRTWIDDGPRSLGTTGQYDKRVRWSRQGTVKPPARVWRWTVHGSVRVRVSAARVNEAF